jgi:peroxiredoxin
MKKNNKYGYEGSIAADTSIKMIDGSSFSLHDELEKGKNIVLFVFPSSSKYSKTCDKQARALNSLVSEMEKYNTSVIGVTASSLKSIEKLSQRISADFPIAQIDKKALKQYSANSKSYFLNVPKRVTFVIGSDKKINKRFDLPMMANGPQMTKHAQDVLKFVAGAYEKKSTPDSNKSFVDALENNPATQKDINR